MIHNANAQYHISIIDIKNIICSIKIYVLKIISIINSIIDINIMDNGIAVRLQALFPLEEGCVVFLLGVRRSVQPTPKESLE